MTKQDFEILMNSLYSNNQLFIPQGQNIKEWVDNAFVEKQEEAINYSRCCKSDSELLKDKEVLSFEDWVKHNYKEGKHRYYSLNGLNCLSYEEVLQKYNVYKQSL